MQDFRVGQRIRVDGWVFGVVCDVREDGTAYAITERENERIMISDKGDDIRPIETLAPGRCKCAGTSLEEHIGKVRSGQAAPHVYGGPHWSARNDQRGGAK